MSAGNTYDKYSSERTGEARLVEGFFGRLDAALPGHPPRRVLEVGAGEGVVSQRVASRYPDVGLVVLDLPDDEVRDDWVRRDLIGTFADIAFLPFPDDTFDLVLGIEVLEHVPDPEAALREIVRVGTDRVVLSVPREPIWRIGNMAKGRYLRDLGNTPGHINHWSSRSFARLVARHLEVDEVARPFPWTMVSARVASRVTSRQGTTNS